MSRWEFRDEYDRPLDADQFRELFTKFSGPAALIKEIKRKCERGGYVPSMVDLAMNLETRWPEIEPRIAAEGGTAYRSYYEFFDMSHWTERDWEKSPAMSPPSVHLRLKGLDKMFVSKLVSWAESPGISGWEDDNYSKTVKIMGHDQLQTHKWNGVGELIGYLEDVARSTMNLERRRDDIAVAKNMFDGELDWSWEQANQVGDYGRDTVWADEYVQEIIGPLFMELFPDLVEKYEIPLDSMSGFAEAVGEIDERELGFTVKELEISISSALVDGYAAGIAGELHTDFMGWFEKWFTYDSPNLDSEVTLVMDPETVAKLIEDEIGFNEWTETDPILEDILGEFPRLQDTLHNSSEWDKGVTKEKLENEIGYMLRIAREDGRTTRRSR